MLMSAMLLAIFPAEFVLGWVSLLGHELAHGMAVHDSGTRCYKGGLGLVLGGASGLHGYVYDVDQAIKRTN